MGGEHSQVSPYCPTMTVQAGDGASDSASANIFFELVLSVSMMICLSNLYYWRHISIDAVENYFSSSTASVFCERWDYIVASLVFPRIPDSLVAT